MLSIHHLIVLTSIFSICLAYNFGLRNADSNVTAIYPEGFPIAWDGDKDGTKMSLSKAPSENGLPSWLDGFFFAQVSGAYGNLSNPDGQKMDHMFDALAGVSVFDLNPEQPSLTSKYYPTRWFKIWEFNDRDMSQSKVSWITLFCPYDESAIKMWSPIASPNHIDDQPNVDFWKIGHEIVAATENAIDVGLQFDVESVTNFKRFPFVDDDEVFVNPRNGPIQAMSMPVHERNAPDGSFYSALVALNKTHADKGLFEELFYIFRVYPNGSRIIEASYPMGVFNIVSDCDPNTGAFIGDKSKLGGYMHSISSTDQTLILPITSALFNICPKPKASQSNDDVIIQPDFFPHMDTEIPLRFLIYNKTSKAFITDRPLNYSAPLFVTHQWNGFELNDTQFVADMMVYNHSVYDDMRPSNYMNESISADFVVNAWRFSIDLDNKTVQASNLYPGDQQPPLEFPQINHEWEGKTYQFGYAVSNVYRLGSSIVKLDMNQPAKNPVAEWPKHRDLNLAMGEPWFVPNPGNSIKEDEGLILVRCSDAKLGLAFVTALDASDLTEIGRMMGPVNVPFGLHNRFYSREQLGMSPTSTTQPVETTTTKSAARLELFAPLLLVLAALNLIRS